MTRKIGVAEVANCNSEKIHTRGIPGLLQYQEKGLDLSSGHRDLYGIEHVYRYVLLSFISNPMYKHNHWFRSRKFLIRNEEKHTFYH